MNLAILQLPRLVVERQSAAVFGVLIIIMLWVIVLLKYIGDVHEDELTSKRNNHNFSMVFEENVLRSIGEIDKALLYLRRTIETRKDTADFHTVVSTTDVLSEIIVQVAIIDAQGIMRASNAGPQPAPALDLSDREHYRVHLNGNQDRLFISKPVVGRVSGKWSVQFTRRFANKDGTFGGVVVASLDPEHFTKFYNRIDFGSSLSIALIGNDGIVRSSGGSAGNFVLGQDLRDSELFNRIKAGANGTFRDTNSSGDTGLTTLRSVKGHPLWVSVSQKRDEIFTDSRATLQLNMMVGAVLTLAILAAMERLLQTEGRARQKTQQLQLTLDHMSQGIILVTKDGQIPIINERCVKLLGLPAQFVDSPPPFKQLLEYKNRGDVLSKAVHPVEPYGHGTAFASKHVAVSDRLMPNGSVIEDRVSTLPDGSFVETFTDITERWKAEADVARLASEDSLTGLPNRRAFRTALERLSKSQRAEGDESPKAKLAVFFLDVDRFKVINDTLGDRVGDLLLQEVAKRLKSTLQPADIVARLGGDEFAIVVPSGESRSELEMLANAIVRRVAEPYELDGYQMRSTVSIGIAIGPQNGETADDLLIAADLALYAVKATKRGAYRFYQASMNSEMNERRQLEVDLRETLERNQLELHYQPVLNLRHHSVVGFEALARWRHASNGIVPPAVFIPVAEDSGLILQLGEWALMEACRQAAKWPAGLHVAVNLSPLQFSSPDLLELIQRSLSTSGLEPHRLELEITERIFMESSETTLNTLRRLKELGVQISLDDFGTGYSSLSYLRIFPFDKIKVDRTFISDLAGATEHVPIVQAVVSIARALGMTTTAEGVETVDQMQFLAAVGCDEAQGYLFSAPVPPENIPEILATYTTYRAVAA